jgi:hypothetical protein
VWKEPYNGDWKIKQSEMFLRNEFIAKMTMNRFFMMRELLKGKNLDLNSLGSHEQNISLDF